MSKNTKKSLLAPALSAQSPYEKADRLSRLAADVGFDWPDAMAALDKVAEETSELASAIADRDSAAISDELGDLLFAVLNVARKAGVDPAAALEDTNQKFVRRFESIERFVSDSGRTWDDFSLDELEAVWLGAKNDERPAK